MTDFDQALKRLVDDPTYRTAVSDDWTRLTHDYKGLDPQELALLMQVWHATGHPQAQETIAVICHCCCQQAE